MRKLAWMLILSLSIFAHAQDNSAELEAAGSSSIYSNVYRFYQDGKYQSVVDELKLIEESFKTQNETNQQSLGLVSYWKGICLNRLQNFSEAASSFETAIKLGYAPADIHYEYGQSLFAAEKLVEARLQFRESLKRKFKRGVSLYYIAYISKELGEIKKAFTFYRMIDKLDDAEAKEVKQAAEMQIGDLYLEQTEKRSDAFRTVETTVIPQYRKAIAVDPDSPLSKILVDKIVKIQRKYDLIMFQLSNGRPTIVPPYFLRLGLEVGQDSNVTFSPAETTISKSKQASLFARTDFLARYTYYPNDSMSIAPEFRFSRTHYFNREPEIFRNDNFLLAPAVRTSFEHVLWKKPAALLFDYDYNETRRDVDANEEFKFNSRSHTLMVGERFNYFSGGESIVRVRYRMLDSYLSSSDSNSTSFVYEQIKSLGLNTALFFFMYDRLRVDDASFDTNSFTFRSDFIFSRVRYWFTPSVGLSLTSTDPINNRSERGRELLINPSARVSKTFMKNWRANLKYDYQKNNSKDVNNFAFTKSIYSFELEYLF